MVDTWEQCYESWSTLVGILKINLNTTLHIRLDESGVWVESGRPMIEEIHELKVRKDPLLFKYFTLMDKPIYVSTPKGRHIHLHVTNKLNLRQAGS